MMLIDIACSQIPNHKTKHKYKIIEYNTYMLDVPSVPPSDIFISSTLSLGHLFSLHMLISAFKTSICHGL